MPEKDHSENFERKIYLTKSLIVAMVRAVFVVVIVAVLFILGELDRYSINDILNWSGGWPDLVKVSRGICVLGILVSMVIQVKVDRYLANIDLYKYTRVPGREWIEEYVGWSYIFLGFGLVALYSILLKHPGWHVLFTLIYLSTTFAADKILSKRTTDYNVPDEFFLRSPAYVMRKFTGELKDMVDYVSLFSLVIVSAICLTIYHFGPSWFHDDVPYPYVSEIFLSGAIGFQLIFSFFLVSAVMERWNVFMRECASFHKLTSNCREPCPTAHCWLEFGRPVDVSKGTAN